jgi:hypothetical protein
MGLPAEPISPEQADDEALNAVVVKQATALPARTHDRSVRRHEGRRGHDDQSAPRREPARTLDVGAGSRRRSVNQCAQSNQGNNMKYMLQVRFSGADAVIGALPADEQEKITAEFQEIRRTPGVLDANQLQVASTATTVRVDDGKTQVSEGPAVAAGAELDGSYIYEAPDLDAPVAFAARIPVARMGGTVEVREMVER